MVYLGASMVGHRPLATRVARGSLLVLAALLCPLASRGQTVTSTAGPSTVTMAVEDADVKDVLQHIARVSGTPIAIGPGVRGRVDLVFDRVPAEAALALTLEAAGLETRRVGEVLVVEPKPAPPQADAPPARVQDDGDPSAEAKIAALLEAYEEPQDSLREVLEGTDHTGTPPGPPPEDTLAPKSAEPGQERPVPNYDGRAPPPRSAGEVLIWVPRAIFWPVHLVLNYLVRVPIVWTLTKLEEHYVFKRIERLITFRDGKSIVLPTFFADFGLRPAVGLTNNNRDLFFAGNNLSLSAAYGGPGFIRATANNTTTVLSDDSGQLQLFGRFEMRPDQPFYGQGPFTSTDNRYNYKIQQLHAGWWMRAVLDDLSWVRFGMSLKDVNFGNAGIRDDDDQPEPRTGNFNDLRNVRVGGANDNIAEGCGSEDFLYDERAQPYLPCGYSGEGYPGYRVLESRVEAKVDTRDPDTEFRAGSGVLLEGFASFEFDPANISRSWVRFGGEMAGFWDFTGVGHTLAVRTYVEFTERTGSENDPIPFTELPTLGGLETMRGFLPRRFIGDSAFMTELSYRYPVWSLLDAELFASVGNVFDGYYRGFSLERLHLSSGLSLRTSFTRASSLQLLVAIGTNRFEKIETDDFEVDSVRVAFGFVQGF